MMKARHLIWMFIVAMTSTAAQAEAQESGTAAQAAAPVTVYVNARVHTQDSAQPWAEAFATHGDRFSFVGSAADALQHGGAGAEVYDLGGRFVLPGLIDAHAHPGLVAMSGDLSVVDGIAPSADRMPSKPKEATLAWLRQYAADHPYAQAIVQGTWDVAEYLPHGPHKRDLDDISITKPIYLFDNSGHSAWVNSAFLRALGIDRNTPDLSPNLSHFVRNENGEPTGWVKEFVLLPYLTSIMKPDQGFLKARLLKYLNYLSSLGVTTLWDAGNFGQTDDVYAAAHALAEAGQLPLRWEGCYHIWAPHHIDGAVDGLLRLRREYSHGDRLRFNTVKIHYDGMQDISTAAMLEPYETDPHGHGGVLFSAERLEAFMIELDGHGIDLHLHIAGDRAARNVLYAIDEARDKLGRPLNLEVTMSHLFSVADEDIRRFRELDVHANFTPHWFGGTVYGDARAVNVGPERANRSQLVGHFVRQGVNVTLSSDVIYNASRSSPFIGIEMSMTRRAMGAMDTEAETMRPYEARLTLEQALAGYTSNGAAQLGMEQEIGAIKTGLLADFVLLPVDPFAIEVESIHRIVPDATVVSGEVVSGSLN